MHSIPHRAGLLVVVATSVACHGTRAAEPVTPCRGVPAPAFTHAVHPSGNAMTRASGFTGRPFGIRVSSAGIVYVTQQDANSVARVRLADLVASPAVSVGADPGDVVFTRDGSTAFVSNFHDGTVHVVDVASGSRTRALVVAPMNAYRLALSPDDSRLYVTSTDGRLYVVDPAGARMTTSVLLGGALQGIALSRDGRSIMVSSAGGGIWRLNSCTLAVTASAETTAFPTQEIALGPDEREIYVANENGYLDVLDASTLQWLRRVDLRGLFTFGVAVTPDGTQLYVTSPRTGQIGIVDRTSGVVRTLSVGGTPRRIAFDARGSTAVISNEGNWVDIIR